MRFSSSLNSLAIALGVTGALFLAAAFADDIGKQGGPIPQKPIASPLLDDLVGSWNTQSMATHDGKEGKGHAKVTFEKGIGDTALLETYDAQMAGPDGKPMTFHGHAVYKISEDGKTATIWWFCNMSPDVMKLTGTITDSAMDLSGDSPMGEKVTLSMKKSGDGFDFKLTEGKNVMTETYAKVR
jgi:hypothetical protein